MDDGPAGWAASGAMAITGDARRPPLAPRGPLAGAVAAVAVDLAATSGVVVDGPAVLGERAALGRLRRQGQVSCGGVTRLLPSVDGWLAVCLARPEDAELLPALVGHELHGETWSALADALRARHGDDIAERAALLGFPLGVLPPTACGGEPLLIRGAPGRARSLRGLRVADLSALWAGPLSASLLGLGGADVVKVESTARPDGAKHGNRRFWRLLNGAKRHHSVDRSQLRDEVDAADIVVLSSRRRAYEQLGIDVDEVLSARTDKVVVAITGYGWDDDRVGFGDDAAVAGGLVVRDPTDGEPRFVADAVADPLTGLHAAAAAARAATSGGRWFVDAALSRVAGAMAAIARADEPALVATRRRNGWMLETDDGSTPVAPARARPA